MRRALLIGLAALMTAWALSTAPALADHGQLSTFQDDQYLLDSSTPAVLETLSILHGLGVQQVRVNVQWVTIAPNPLATKAPSGFNPDDPADYPANNWAPYDRLVQDATALGMSVDFNVTAPGPLWAMARHAPTTRAANHWEPNATQFSYFVYALGARYNGAPYGEPRVSTWSIWNEPNQPGWLAPQWRRVHGKQIAESPRLYRSYADAAYRGLYFSGHGRDTILIGETAPEGYEKPGFYTAMTPLPFLRDLYCVDARGRRLRGTAAGALGCPQKGSAAAFVAAHPVLFHATGYAHHPYFFFHAPAVSASDPNFIPLANLGRLARFLSGAFRTYGVRRQLPIYLTEYGYQTNPPDPYEVVSPAEQAAYLNEADYMAWQNPRVRAVSQFLLFDARPDSRYTAHQFGYWDTFQTGLLYANATYKPAFYAYRMPIWIPSARFRRGTPTFIWGQVRPADRLPTAQRVAIQWRPAHGGYRTIAVARTAVGTGYLTARVRLPGSGVVKLSWASPDPNSTVLHSRAVVVTATR
jgi:hypothetical protein